MRTNIFAIRIITDTILPSNPEIGLYAVSGGKTELRYSEAPLVGVDLQWKTGFIPKGGIPTIDESGSFQRGGGLVQMRQTNIRLKNTQRLQAFFEMNGINLTGGVCEIIEFVGTDQDSDEEEIYVHYNAICEDVKWNDIETILSVVPSRQRLRDVNIGTEGTPVSFGSSNPEEEIFYKLTRVNNQVDQIYTEDFANFEGEYHPAKLGVFPVSGAIAGLLGYRFRVGSFDSEAADTAKIQKFIEDGYVFVTNGENQGVYRKITSLSIAPIVHAEIDEDEHQIEFSISNYFEEPLVWDLLVTNEDQTWLKYFLINRVFNGDVWACNGFFSSEDVKFIDRATIYAKRDDQMIQLPDSAVDIESIENSALKIVPTYFRDSPDNVRSMICKPVVNFRLNDDDTVGGNYQKLFDGYYIEPSFPVTPTTYGTGGFEKVTDLNYETFGYVNMFFTDIGSYDDFQLPIVSVKFDLPSPPPHAKRAFLGVNIEFNDVENEDDLDVVLFRIYLNKYFKIRRNIVPDGVRLIYGKSTLDNTPDFLYHPQRTTGNKNFFVNTPPSHNFPPLGDRWELYTKYSNLLIAEDMEEYNELVEPVQMEFDLYLPTTGDIIYWIKFFQVCVMFEMEDEVKDVIYV